MKFDCEMGLKVCSVCKCKLSLDHFYMNKRCSDGYDCQCKNCKKNYVSSERGRLLRRERNKRWRTSEKGKVVYRKINDEYRRSEKGKKSNEKSRKRRNLLGKSSLYYKEKRISDINYKISSNLRGRLLTALKNNQKSGHTLDLLGCSIDELKAHLEMQFEPGMTWDNLGKGEGKWQIDHIIPCSYFDLTKEENQRICFNYRNLQPLWAKDNLEKSNSVSDNIEELVEFLKQEINENIC